VPASANVAVVLLAALVPFALKVTGAGTVPMAAQVKVRLEAPAGSVAVTDRFAVVPMTGFGLEAAAPVIVGPETPDPALPSTSTLIEYAGNE
jgi:hypothetical protein